MSKVEEQIRKAMQEGKFNDLPGAGKPLKLNDNPHEDSRWRLAHHLLRSNGFSLPWIERRREIEKTLNSHRKALERAWRWREKALTLNQPASFVESRWEDALRDFQEGIIELNQRIFSYNLSIPLTQFHMHKIDPGGEIMKITGAQPRAG